VAQVTPDSPAATEPLLKVRGLEKHFGAVQALYAVDLDLPAGYVTALCGDNGAGKSVFTKCISGVYQPDHGQVFWEGMPVHVRSTRDASRLGIETVYQDLALCDNLDVVANLFLGREEHTPALSLRENDMELRGLGVLRTLEVKIPSVRSLVASLSGGQRQSIAVAKAILRNARVVLLDEPTAALGVAQTRQVLNLILRLRDQGLAVVVISHNLADVFEVVDRVIVLRLGRRVATFDVKTTTPERVVAAITGAEFGELRSATTKDNGVSEGVTNNE